MEHSARPAPLAEEQMRGSRFAEVPWCTTSSVTFHHRGRRHMDPLCFGQGLGDSRT